MSLPPLHPDAIAQVYRAAGEPVRARLLAELAHGERCVCHLHEALDAPQPTVSRHLAVLRRVGLVRARREGAWVHYALTDLAERWLAPALCAWRDATPPPDPPLDPRCCP
jgi:ArsR family transcriptional regulator